MSLWSIEPRCSAALLKMPNVVSLGSVIRKHIGRARIFEKNFRAGR
jgi:hypothetical protein